jgi:hypothetical protein
MSAFAGHANNLAVGVPGGADIAGRLGRAALSLGAAAFGHEDGGNAFNGARRDKSVRGLNHVDGAQPFTRLRYGNAPLVEFKTRSGEVAVSTMQERGSIQGCALAMVAFCVAQEKALKEGNEQLDTAQTPYADDAAFAGPVADIVRDAEKASNAVRAGLGIARSNLTVYAPGATADELDELAAAGATIKKEGTIYVGTAIGTDDFVRAHALRKADEILTLLAHAEKVAAEDPSNGIQLVFDWIRKTAGPTFNHVLRNTPPDLVRAAAQKLDAATAETVIRLCGIADVFADAPPEDQERAKALIQLPIDEGGLGFHSQELIAEAAYVGAWSASLNRVVGAQGLKLAQKPDVRPAFLDAFHAAVEKLRPNIPAELASKLDWRALWDAPLAGAQALLSRALHADARKRLLASLPTGASLDERALRLHAIAQNSPEASAWLLAKVYDQRQRLHNGAFTLAIRTRLLLSVDREGKACGGCGADLDNLDAHALCCKKLGGDQNVRHTSVQEAVREFVRPQCAVLIGGPRVSDFYARQLPVAGEAIDNTEWRGDLGYTFKNTAAGTPDIFDAVVTAVVKSAPALYVSVGDAAKAAESEKLRLYRKRFKIDDHIVPFGVEATGALGPSAKALLWRVASNDDAAPDIRSARYRYYICRLSVVLKASAYTMYKRYLTKCVDSLKPPADGE